MAEPQTDWFAQNAPPPPPPPPAATGGDWFSQHAPPDIQTTAQVPTEAQRQAAFADKLAAAQPSTVGFVNNTLSSGAKLLGDTVQGAANLVTPTGIRNMAASVADLVSKPGLTATLIKDAAVKRYGSIDNFLHTLYTDPVGAASDASMVLGAAGMAAKASGAMRSAQLISDAAEALNPLAIPSKAGQMAGQALYTSAVGPSRAIRRSFPNAMQAGYEMNALPTEGGLARAEDALAQSATHTDAQLAAADAAGAPRVTASQITPAFQDALDRAKLRLKAGLPDETPALQARQAATGQSLQFGQSLSRANDIKQEVQGVADAAFRAQDKGTLINDLDALATKNVAQAYRKAIEVNAASVGIDDIAASNQKTQALIGLTKALEDATQQPTRLTHLMATLEGMSNLATGGLGAAGAGYAGVMAAMAKPTGAFAGLAMGKGSKLARNAQVMRGLALLGALQQPDQQQGAQ
jgi:hypothetical protein